MGAGRFLKERVLAPVGRGLKAVGGAIVEVVVDLLDKMIARQQYLTAMAAIGWPPTRLFDKETQQVVLTALGNRTPVEARKDIEAALLVHFTGQRLQDLLAEWRKSRFTSSRVHLMQDVIKAHEAGLYGVVTPTVHSQIEGVLADVFQIHGPNAWRKLLKSLAHTPIEWGAHRTAHEFIAHRVISTFRRGMPLEPGHNRHAIAHGYDVLYASPESSLKAILLFDYVAWAMEEMYLIENGVCHLPDCKAIQMPFERLEPVRGHFGVLLRQHNQGLRYCVSCMQTQHQIAAGAINTTATLKA